jgi:glucokinase
LVGSGSLYGAFVGTGFGGGYVTGGQLVNKGGVAGEIGHTCIDLRAKKAQLCGCGRRGCVETFASKSGLLVWLRARKKEENSQLSGTP